MNRAQYWKSQTAWLAAGLMALAVGCGDDAGSKAPSPKPSTSTPSAPAPPTKAATPAVERTPEQMVEAGRGVYNGNCIACHSTNPAMDGALGPAVAGSSLELIEARVVRGEYPEGYTPKRPTKVMVALPHLEPKLPELAAYLGSL